MRTEEKQVEKTLNREQVERRLNRLSSRYHLLFKREQITSPLTCIVFYSPFCIFTDFFSVVLHNRLMPVNALRALLKDTDPEREKSWDKFQEIKAKINGTPNLFPVHDQALMGTFTFFENRFAPALLKKRQGRFNRILDRLETERLLPEVLNRNIVEYIIYIPEDKSSLKF